jgi:hypothetical protein
MSDYHGYTSDSVYRRRKRGTPAVRRALPPVQRLDGAGDGTSRRRGYYAQASGAKVTKTYTDYTLFFDAQYDIDAFGEVVRFLDGVYDLQAFAQTNRFLDASYDQQAFIRTSRYLDASYDQLAFSPVTKYLDASFDLNTFTATSRFLDGVYDLNAFASSVKYLDGAYDVQAFVEQTKFLDASYDLNAFETQTRFLDASYDINTLTPVTRYADATYDLNAFVVRTRFLDAAYDVNAFAETKRYLDGAYDINVYEQVVRFVDGYYDLLANEVFYGYAINLDTNTVTKYENFNFNSLGPRYGAKSDGIYRFTGTDDNGTRIDWSAKTGKLAFGATQTRVTDAYLNVDTDGDLTFTMTADSGTTAYTAKETNTMKKRKLDLAQGHKGQYWQFEVKNKASTTATGELNEVELIVQETTRRI